MFYHEERGVLSQSSTFGSQQRYRRIIGDDSSNTQLGVQLHHLASSTQPPCFDKRHTFDAILSGISQLSPSPWIPVEQQKTPLVQSNTVRAPTGRRKYFSGWRVGAAASTLAATLLLVVNSTVTIWVWKNPRYPIADGIGTLYQGSCQDSKAFSRWLHLAINITSTLMLACSNYCMQYLISPNWDELVKAHAQRRWLHIGVPNLRNLLNIAWDRSILWILLALSSMPLHILFNSVVFSNLQANTYAVVTGSESFLAGDEWDRSGLVNVSTPESNKMSAIAESIRDKARNRTGYVNLTTPECFHAYDSQYVSAFGNVLLVQEETIWHDSDSWATLWTNSTAYTWEPKSTFDSEDIGGRFTERGNMLDRYPFISQPEQYPTNGWRCTSRNVSTCDINDKVEVPADLNQWAPYGSPVKYCLAEIVQEHCKVQFSFSFAIAVIACNVVKAFCMAITLWKHRKPSLVTLGDTIAAFLDQPDPTTKGRCLYDRFEFQREWHWVEHYDASNPPAIPPERYLPKKTRWARASSRSRWLFTYVLYISAIAFSGVAISRSVQGFSQAQMWRSGIGTLNGNNLLSLDASLLGSVILANIPQAVLSYLYLTFNALLTCMLVADEWTHYFDPAKPKPLRVSAPAGKQRSTYWLNVPWKYGIPLTILSGLLHWLASQSVFMVRIAITAIDSATADRVDNAAMQFISTCGYSPVAIIATTIVGSIIVLGGIIVSLRRYPAGMPLASSCSAAISAACHPPDNDLDAAVSEVHWGCVGYDERGVGHCTFTSTQTTEPIRGKRYA